MGVVAGKWIAARRGIARGKVEKLRELCAKCRVRLFICVSVRMCVRVRVCISV